MELSRATAEKMAGLPEMLSAKEVAKLIGVTTKTIRRWIKEGKFPDAKRVSRKTHRWDKEVVWEWIKDSPKGKQTKRSE